MKKFDEVTPDQLTEEQVKHLKHERLQALVPMAYGLLVVFCLVGTLAGKQLAATSVMLITVIVWVLSRIIKEAWNSFVVFRAVGEVLSQRRKDG